MCKIRSKDGGNLLQSRHDGSNPDQAIIIQNIYISHNKKEKTGRRPASTKEAEMLDKKIVSTTASLIILRCFAGQIISQRSQAVMSAVSFKPNIITVILGQRRFPRGLISTIRTLPLQGSGLNWAFTVVVCICSLLAHSDLQYFFPGGFSQDYKNLAIQ